MLYKRLSLKRKEDLLSQVALTTFEQKDYFFKQKAVEGYIADYISNLPDAKTDPEALLLDSEAVLKSIEGQHGLLIERARGIYSFSHLTFQEYFTAREIVTNSTLETLISHLSEKRWREVVLLSVGMLRHANDLISRMKHRIDQLLAVNEKHQKFLHWVQQKTDTVQLHYKPAAVRAFYLVLALDHDLTLAFDRDFHFSLDRNLHFSLDRNLNLDVALTRALNSALNIHHSLALDLDRDFTLAFRSDFDRDFTPLLRQALQDLKGQLPNPDDNYEARKEWWKNHDSAWTEQLRAVMIEHRNIGHDWQFNNEQKQLLHQYHDANKLLVDCLNSDCYVSKEVRQEIEDTLLLPIAEIEKYKAANNS